MTDGDTLANALADVRRRRADVQAEYDRAAAELTKLRAAENALTAIVEGASRDPAAGLAPDAEPRPPAAPRAGGRGARGPRANSAKGRLKALLAGSGPQGLTQAEIARRLADVAPATLNTYLSLMVTGGEAVRRGDFFAAGSAGETADDGDADGNDVDASEAEGDAPDADEDDGEAARDTHRGR